MWRNGNVHKSFAGTLYMAFAMVCMVALFNLRCDVNLISGVYNLVRLCYVLTFDSLKVYLYAHKFRNHNSVIVTGYGPCLACCVYSFWKISDQS